MPAQIMFVRFWEGFTDKFPVEDFNSLADDALHATLDQYAKDYLANHRKELGKWYREHVADIKRYVATERAQCIPSPKEHWPRQSGPHLRRQRTLLETLKAASPGCRTAWLAGWTDQVLSAWGKDRFGQHMFPSPRIPLCKVPDEQAATQIIGVLTKRLPELEGVNPTYRPHLGYVSATEQTQVELVAAMRSFRDIESEKPTPLIPLEKLVAKIIFDEANQAASDLGLVAPTDGNDRGQAPSSTTELTVQSVAAKTGDADGRDEAVRPKHPGRKPDTDPKADAQIYHAWTEGAHKTYAALARDKDMTGMDVKRAIDRHQHRQRKEQ